MKIKTGSVIYSLAGPPPVRFTDRLKLADAIVRNPGTAAEGADLVLGPLERLSHVARVLDTEITLRDPSRPDVVLARFSGNSYSQVARSLLVSGDTELFGHVLRVGGATERKCMLRLPSQQNAVFCRGSCPRKSLASWGGGSTKRCLSPVQRAGFVVIGTSSASLSGKYRNRGLGSLLEAREAVRKAGGATGMTSPTPRRS